MTTTTRSAPAHRMSNRRSPLLGWLLRLTVVALLVVLLGACSMLVLVLAAPSVNHAPDRVAAILAAHGAPSDEGLIPEKVSTALLATENSRYYEDPALDPLGVARTALGLLTRNGNDGGATIEQQLAKMLYAPGTGVGAELEQVGTAFRLDQHFSKTEILAMYLNAAYFGDGAYGVTAASLHYFGLQPSQLSWAQASLIAGLVQAPTRYDPHGHLSLARSRQSHVLQRLVATGTLTSKQAKQIFADPLDPAVPFYG